MEVEEKRLDKMMEVDRVNAIVVDEEIEAKRKQERLLGAMKIMEQIQENEQVSLYNQRHFSISIFLFIHQHTKASGP